MKRENCYSSHDIQHPACRSLSVTRSGIGRRITESRGGERQGAATSEVQVAVRRRAGVRGGISITVPTSLSAALPSATPYFFYRRTRRNLNLEPTTVVLTLTCPDKAPIVAAPSGGLMVPPLDRSRQDMGCARGPSPDQAPHQAARRRVGSTAHVWGRYTSRSRKVHPLGLA
jgi:hypothetical protein